MRRIPYHFRDKVEEKVDDLIEKNFVEYSDAPLVSVMKENGDIRLYRKLNEKTIPTKFPIPPPDEIFDKLNNKKVFCVLDLKNDYYHIVIRPEDRHKTAFSLPWYKLQFIRMAQGLLGAPFTCTESVVFLLRDFIEFCDGFFDDVIIFSETIEEHLIHLEKVLNKLAEYGMFINFEKCQFAMNSVNFLGHNISDKGILPTVQNLQKILDFSLPKDADHLRSFLGMCSFYKKFVPDYSNLVAPLFELLRKNAKLIWSEECNKNFELLKEKLQKSPVLISPDFKKPYIIQTDASNKGLG